MKLAEELLLGSFFSSSSGLLPAATASPVLRVMAERALEGSVSEVVAAGMSVD